MYLSNISFELALCSLDWHFLTDDGCVNQREILTVEIQYPYIRVGFDMPFIDPVHHYKLTVKPLL